MTVPTQKILSLNNSLSAGLKVMLVKSTYSPNVDTDLLVANLLAHEVSGANYTSEGVNVPNASIQQDAANDRVTLTGDPAVFSNVTLDSRPDYAVFHDGTDIIATTTLTWAPTDPTSVVNADITVTPPAGLILTIN